MPSNKIIYSNAILIALMIAAFFFLTKLIGMEDNPYLRFFNLLFLVIGIHRAIKTNLFKKGETKYLQNFGIGLMTGVVAVVLSVIGVIVYAKWINPEFMETLSNSFLIGKNLNIYEIIFTLMLEGLASTVVGSFMVMQFYKNHTKEDVVEKKF
jgi:hypothetical protein